MMLTRRGLLRQGGGLLATLPIGRLPALALDVADVAMAGDGTGARVWFDPIGLLVLPGQSIRWTNRDRGNVHTATAYHPENSGKPLRIPRSATAWDSGFLMPGASFSVTLTELGIYDYFCIPHEMAGMAGRIVVGGGAVGDAAANGEAEAPLSVLNVLPDVETILEKGIVRSPQCEGRAPCN